MKFWLLPFLFCILIFNGHAQDFLVLKKNGRTIDKYFADSYITLFKDKNTPVGGYIQSINNDTITIKQFYTRRAGNPNGLMYVDTVWLPVNKIDVNNIYAFPRKRSSFEYIKNGALFKIGSGGYIFLNLANALINKLPAFDETNTKRLSVAAGLFGAGEILHLLRPKIIVTGKKYQVVLVQMK